MSLDTVTVLLGMTITGIYGLLYRSAEDQQSEMAAVWIRCDNGVGVRFTGCSDGMHLRCDGEFPWPFDMQEDGAYVLVDISVGSPWSAIRGQCIVQLAEVVTRETGMAIGVGLQWARECSLYILNLGDELRAFGVLPAEIIIQENAEVKTL